MDKFLFKTKVTMKEYNQASWWIDSDIIKDFCVVAESLKDALKEYSKIVCDKCYIDISNNALKHKNGMYIDTSEGIKQIGYVITGSTEFQKNDYTWSKQFIDLWIEISKISEVDF